MGRRDSPMTDITCAICGKPKQDVSAVCGFFEGEPGYIPVHAHADATIRRECKKKEREMRKCQE